MLKELSTEELQRKCPFEYSNNYILFSPIYSG